jgi:hypothetical protein
MGICVSGPRHTNRWDLGFRTSTDGKSEFGFQDLDGRTEPLFCQVKIGVRKGRPIASPASPFPHPPKCCGYWSSVWGGYKGLNAGPCHICSSRAELPSSRAELIVGPVGLTSGVKIIPGQVHLGPDRLERRAWKSSRAELILSPVSLNVGRENHPEPHSSQASTDRLTEFTHARPGRPERRARHRRSENHPGPVGLNTVSPNAGPRHRC